MDKLINRQHIGIIMTVIGTVILAFSTKIIKQKGIGLQVLEEDKKIIKPNQTFIDKGLFWLGLEFIALGSLLQW